MTWAEFKAAVDAKLNEEGKTDQIEIWYIDVSYPKTERVDIWIHPSQGLAVEQ